MIRFQYPTHGRKLSLTNPTLRNGVHAKLTEEERRTLNSARTSIPRLRRGLEDLNEHEARFGVHQESKQVRETTEKQLSQAQARVHLLVIRFNAKYADPEHAEPPLQREIAE